MIFIFIYDATKSSNVGSLGRPVFAVMARPCFFNHLAKVNRSKYLLDIREALIASANGTLIKMDGVEKIFFTDEMESAVPRNSAVTSRASGDGISSVGRA